VFFGGITCMEASGFTPPLGGEGGRTGGFHHD